MKNSKFKIKNGTADPEVQLQQEEHGCAFLITMFVIWIFYAATSWLLAAPARAWRWIKPNNFNHAPAMGPLSPSTSVASAAPSPAHPPGQTGLADAAGA